MIRHIIMWDFKDGFTDEQNAANAAELKKRLEALVGVIPGLVSLKLNTEPIAPRSNRHILLDSVFKDKASLDAYIPHPAHVAVSQFARTVMQNLSCFDYEE